MAEKQKRFHILFEALGVVAGVLLIYFSTQVDFKIGIWLFVMGLGNLIVDGYFLTTWRYRTIQVVK